MLSLLFGLLVLFIGVSALRWFGRADPKDVRKAINWGVLSLILLVIVGLMVTGRMGAAMAGLVVLAGWIGRILSVVQMGRQFRDMFGGRSANAGEGAGPPPNSGGAMSVAEAARILGVAPNAGEDDVKAAYRRLMSQLHPDHGGSDYLAAKVNQAKDVMLKKQ
jgi:DnaJ family protein C protein 19